MTTAHIKLRLQTVFQYEIHTRFYVMLPECLIETEPVKYALKVQFTIIVENGPRVHISL